MLSDPIRRARLAHTSALFLLFAAATLSGSLAIDRSVLYDRALPPFLRWALLAHEVSLVAVLLLATDLVRSAFARRNAHSDPAGRRARRLGAFAILWAALFAYAASWAAFALTGTFLGRGGLSMFAENPRQVVAHAAQLSALTLLLVPAVSGVVAVLATFWLPGALRRHAGLERSVLASAGLTAVLMALVAAAGSTTALFSRETVAERETGSVISVSMRYDVGRTERAGPLSAAGADAIRGLFPRARAAVPLELERVHHRSRVSINDYLDRTDRDRVRPLNVIFILVESLRADQLPAFGGSRNVLPELQRVAEESVLFTNAYAQSSHSNYADLPPLSSHYPLRSFRTHSYPERPTYPRVLIYDVLKALGYRTAIISSQNENWGSMLNYLDTGSIDHLLHAENYEEALAALPAQGGAAPEPPERRAGKLDDRYTVEAAMRWIGAAGEGRFFLYTNLQSSHFPYEIPADFPRRYAPPDVRLPRSMGSRHAVSDFSVLKDLYADSLAYLDVQLGRLFEHLRSAGLWEETLIVVTADTGTALSEHDFWGNGGDLFNEVIQVPLIIRCPGRAPRRDQRLAEHVDLPPSVLDLLGLPPHPAFQGRSLFSERRPARAPAFAVSQSPISHQYALIADDGWKLIYDVRRDRFLLYDLAADPRELDEISARRPELALRLARELLTWEQAQLAYYADPDAQRRSYPPVLLPRAAAGEAR